MEKRQEEQCPLRIEGLLNAPGAEEKNDPRLISLNSHPFYMAINMYIVQNLKLLFILFVIEDCESNPSYCLESFPRSGDEFAEVSFFR